MSDETRLISEFTTDTYSNSVGNKIAVVKIENNLMMTAKEIAKLYGVSRAYVSMRLIHLYRTKVLNKKLVSNIFAHRAKDGKLYETRYYKTEAIIALGRVIKTDEAERFINWLGDASQHLQSESQNFKKLN